VGEASRRLELDDVTLLTRCILAIREPVRASLLTRWDSRWSEPRVVACEAAGTKIISSMRIRIGGSKSVADRLFDREEAGLHAMC